MKYYLVKVQIGETCACFPYDDLDTAEREFHTELAYRAVDRTATMCLIINENGAVVESGKYRAPAPAPEPEVGGDA